LGGTDGDGYKRRTHSLSSAISTLLLHLPPLLYRIPSYSPLRPLRKPLILQELPHTRPVSRVELHNLKKKGFIRITNLPFAERLEWFQLLRRHRRHDANERFLRVFVGEFLKGDGERPEPLMLMHDDFRVVEFVAFWLFRLEDVEVETPDEVDELGQN